MSDSVNLPACCQTIPEALAFWAEQTPEAPAIRSVAGEQLAYGELRDVAARITDRLRAQGVAPDSRVVLLLPPGFHLCVALLGTMAAGAAVPVDPAATCHELTRDLGRLPSRLVVVGGSQENAIRELVGDMGMETTNITALLTPSAGKQDHNGASRLPDPESIALILHTSGTTGLPKRAPRTHRALCLGARAAAERTGLIRTDVGLVATGFYNISGLGNMFNALLSGGCCVVAPAFDPAHFSDWLDMHKPTWMFAAPTHLNLLLPAIPPEGMPQSALRLVRAGTQAMMPGTIERVEKSLGAIVLETYGMTEASALTASGPSAADRRAGSCGRILAVDVRILDGAGGDVPPGATGEIVVRGPTVFAGYLDDPEATAEAFLPGGWFRTGDVGYVDEDGYLFLTGRGKDQINRGGVQIAPLEVDRVLLEHPAVAEAAVFAIPDQRLGEDVVAAVVWRQGVTATSRELRSWLLDRLPPAKTPRRIWTLDSLPRTATGKVQRAELTRLWLEARG